MSIEDILMDTEDRMDKALGVLKNNLAGIRTGRATPGLLDSVKVTIYGSQTPLKQLASVGAPEPQQLVIRPFDSSTIAVLVRESRYTPAYGATFIALLATVSNDAARGRSR